MLELLVGGAIAGHCGLEADCLASEGKVSHEDLLVLIRFTFGIRVANGLLRDATIAISLHLKKSLIKSYDAERASKIDAEDFCFANLL